MCTTNLRNYCARVQLGNRSSCPSRCSCVPSSVDAPNQLGPLHPLCPQSQRHQPTVARRRPRLTIDSHRTKHTRIHICHPAINQTCQRPTTHVFFCVNQELCPTSPPRLWISFLCGWDTAGFYISAAFILPAEAGICSSTHDVQPTTSTFPVQSVDATVSKSPTHTRCTIWSFCASHRFSSAINSPRSSVTFLSETHLGKCVPSSLVAAALHRLAAYGSESQGVLHESLSALRS